MLELTQRPRSIAGFRDKMTMAGFRDSGRPLNETHNLEFVYVMNSICIMCQHLEGLAETESMSGFGDDYRWKPAVRKEPLGCVLIVG